MATFGFSFPQLAFDQYARQPSPWRQDGKLFDRDGVEVTTSSIDGVPGPLRTGSTGVIAPFRADIDAGVATFGDGSRTLVLSDDFILLRDRVDDLVALARQAADDANAALAKAQPISHVGFDPVTGRPYISRTPIETGGGVPVYEGARLFFLFPVTL